MKKFVKIIIGTVIILSLMFTEYRFIMHNIHPYLGNNNTIYLEFYGMIDEYYVEGVG